MSTKKETVFLGNCIVVPSTKDLIFCLFVSKITLSYEQILIRFSGNVDNVTRNRCLNFGGLPD